MKNKFKKPIEVIREKNKFDIHLSQNEECLEQETIIDNNQSHNGAVFIDIKNISKTFGIGDKKFYALNNISFKLYENENVALIGANGAGKTTFVEILSGVHLPSSGNIEYLYDYENNFQEKIGIQFQESIYPSGLKVKNIIRFIIDVYNIDINKSELNQIVEAFGLKDLYNKNAKSLSGGQQQRLNILLALIHKPKLVILDELSTGLDISVRNKIIDFIILYCQKFKIQILLISHNMDEVEKITDRIIIFQKGVLKVDLKTKDVITKYQSVENLAKKYI